MLAPVRTAAPTITPVSLAEVKAHLIIPHDDDDAMINTLIVAATAYLDGWTGILGRCLVEQSWRQDYDRFSSCMPLPIGPVISVTSVTWRNSAGQISTVAPSAYALRTDAGGRSIIRFDADFSFPADLHESAAVSITYRAGYPTTPAVPADPGPPVTPEIPAQSAVPDSIKVAILLLVGQWYATREAISIGDAVIALPFAVDALLAPYRRVGV